MPTATPEPSSAAAARRMLNTRRRDTPFELAVRRRIHALGLRYFVDRPIPGVTRARPDIVFPRIRVAVFLDGCFWHRCPIHGSSPTANGTWWRTKLDQNAARDKRHNRELRQAGWRVLRFWEHEDPARVVETIHSAVVEEAAPKRLTAKERSARRRRGARPSSD